MGAVPTERLIIHTPYIAGEYLAGKYQIVCMLQRCVKLSGDIWPRIDRQGTSKPIHSHISTGCSVSARSNRPGQEAYKGPSPEPRFKRALVWWISTFLTSARPRTGRTSPMHHQTKPASYLIPTVVASIAQER